MDLYNYYLSKGDERVKDWFGMEDPILTLIILAAYILSIILIKFFMKNREAFELKNFLLVYNFFQVVASFYIFYEVLTVAIQSRYSLTCEVVNYSNDSLAVRMARALWLYYVIKLVDLLDTVLFALRKKSNQISFLHVFHHSSMVINGWIGVKFVPGGQTFFLCMFNSFVHVLMYTYYGLSSLGPGLQKYLWWKKYLTQIQLIQFLFVMIHSIFNILDTKCTYPKGFSWSFVIYGVFITALFMNFYQKAYTAQVVKSKDVSKAAKKSS